MRRRTRNPRRPFLKWEPRCQTFATEMVSDGECRVVCTQTIIEGKYFISISNFKRNYEVKLWFNFFSRIRLEYFYGLKKLPSSTKYVLKGCKV